MAEQKTDEPCDHRNVETFMFTGDDLVASVAMWACADCHVRFYPACPTCVDVGHRNIVHTEPPLVVLALEVVAEDVPAFPAWGIEGPKVGQVYEVSGGPARWTGQYWERL